MCEKIHEQRGTPTPCEECLPPLFPENKDALRVFFVVQDQVIMAPMGGVVSLNHEAIHRAMGLYGVRDKRSCFEKVLRLAREFLVKRVQDTGHIH